MFDRKRKTGKYKFIYGKSPVLQNTFRQGFRTQVNPTGRPHPTITKIKRIFVLLVILGITLFGVYAIFFSKYFIITDISLKNKELESQNIAEKIKKNISKAIGGNIIFTNTQELEKIILTSFPELEKVTVEKNYPHTILIDFSEYPLVANVINESNNIKKSYIINTVGFVVKEDYEDKNLPYIRIKSEEPLNIKNTIIDSANLNYIINTIDYFEDKFGMRIVEVIYKPIPREIHLITERGFAIWLDIQRSAEEQLKKLKKTLVKLDIYKDNFAYIDLRIAGNNGDKIIYKRK